ncbi:MAG: LacI family DNA-binding transcriptional regulator [Clostridiales bacterium]|nr:LacI family DNA-binding transcriptional regulator [Clostridiales bacterium]
MAVTIKDVAAKCGLSISTVSKAFNNYADISAATREAVQRAAKEIGYFPNAIARTLKTNRSFNLGVLFQEERGTGLTHSFFAAVLQAFKTESEKRGYDITFINHNIGWNGMTYLEHCQYRNVDGVCVVCASFYAPEVIALVNSDIPVVTIDHAFANRSCVLSENLEGMQALVNYAASLGHRRIAYVHGQKASVTEKRITGYYRGLEANGIEPKADYLLASTYASPEAGAEAFRQLMALPEPPTCILLPDDHAALGALDAAAEMGLRVPGDVSIAGFDESRLAALTRPRLTTVSQDAAGMGRRAAQLLIERIENPRTAGSETGLIPTRLIKGESIGAVAAQ